MERTFHMSFDIRLKVIQYEQAQQLVYHIDTVHKNLVLLIKSLQVVRETTELFFAANSDG